MKNKMIITAKAKGISRTVPASLIIEVVLEATKATHEEALDAVNNSLQELSQKILMDNIGKLIMVGNPSVKDDSLTTKSVEKAYTASVSCKIECSGVNPIIAETAFRRVKASKNVVSMESHYELDADQYNSLSAICIRDCYQKAKKRAIDLYKIAMGLLNTDDLVATPVNSNLEDIVFGDYHDYYVPQTRDIVCTSDACVYVVGTFEFEIYISGSPEDLEEYCQESVFSEESDGIPLAELK